MSNSLQRCDGFVVGFVSNTLTPWRNALLGLGLRQFSMHPAQLPAIKQQVLRTGIPDIMALARRIARSHDPKKSLQLLAQLNT